MTTANTFYDGPSLSLAAGTWLLHSTITLGGGTGIDDFTSKLWDGTSVYASTQTSQSIGFENSHSLTAIVTLSGTTTVKVSATCTVGSKTMRKACANNGAGNNASTLTAVQLA
jgi:hypothetical protein